MRRPNAEGRTCEVCGRRLLAGEPFHFFDDLSRRRYRRPVCALCHRDALSRGWTRTPELPRTDYPPAEAH